MPSFFHSPCDSPRSPYERHSTRTLAPRDAYSAMAPPARQTKSAACALTTSNLSFDKSIYQSQIPPPAGGGSFKPDLQRQRKTPKSHRRQAVDRSSPTYSR